MFKFRTPIVSEAVYVLAERIANMPIEEAHEVETPTYIASVVEDHFFVRMARKCLPFQEWATNGIIYVFKFRSAHICTKDFSEFYYVVKKSEPRHKPQTQEVPIIQG